MRNSCGMMCRIFWSAGMATVRAASMTRSTAPGVTSRSRMATMPCELRLRTWLPAIPAYTSEISQPAISSASSTARCIDSTVDSILTTTPFFRPREGWLPMPIISSPPSSISSPTIATTLEVPISSPTIVSLALRLAIVRRSLTACGRGAALAPAHGKAAAVAQVHVADFGHPGCEQRRGHAGKAPQPCLEGLAAEAQLQAVAQLDTPRAALVELEHPQAEADRGERRARIQVLAGHDRFTAVGPGQARQFGRHVTCVVHEQFPPGVEEAAVAPARRRRLLDDGDLDFRGPAAAHHRVIHPVDSDELFAQLLEPHAEETRRSQAADRRFDLQHADALERSVHGHRLNGTIQQQRHTPGPGHERTCENSAAGEPAPGPCGQRRPAPLKAGRGRAPGPAGGLSARHASPPRPSAARNWFPAHARPVRRNRFRPVARPSARGCDWSCPGSC